MTTQLRRVAWILPLLCLLGSPLALAAPAGNIEKLSGEVLLGRDANTLRPARANDEVHEGDLLATGNGEALIRFTDNALLTLRPQTRMVVTTYSDQGEGKGNYAFSLLRGAFRAVTGLIGKVRPEAARFSTPTATIGIRGTDFELAVVTEDSADTRAGTYNYVHSGGTRMRLANREDAPGLDVQPEETGLALANPGKDEAPLQILKQRPAFLRGGGFDAHMMQFGAQPMRAIQFMPRR